MCIFYPIKFAHIKNLLYLCRKFTQYNKYATLTAVKNKWFTNVNKRGNRRN